MYGLWSSIVHSKGCAALRGFAANRVESRRTIISRYDMVLESTHNQICRTEFTIQREVFPRSRKQGLKSGSVSDPLQLPNDDSYHLLSVSKVNGAEGMRDRRTIINL